MLKIQVHTHTHTPNSIDRRERMGISSFLGSICIIYHVSGPILGVGAASVTKTDVLQDK